MPRYTIPLVVVLDAESSDAAFADVRTNFVIVRDVDGNLPPQFKPVEFFVGEAELADDDTEVDDLA